MGKRRTKKLSRNYMDLVFVPQSHLEYEVDEEGTVTLLMEHTGVFDRIAQRFFHRPKLSRVRLDACGSCLWRSLDGQRSVWELVEQIKKAFPEEQEDMHKRVVSFLGTLQRNRFIREKSSE